MYEPPNRGGKTWTALSRVAPAATIPASITDPDGARELVPDAARLHDGVERLGRLAPAPSNANFNTTITLPVAQEPGRLVDHRPGLRIHRQPAARRTR